MSKYKSTYESKILERVEKKADVINNKPSVKQNNSHDVKTHSSFGDFKTGMKHGAYAYVGITLASMIAGPLLLATSPYLILPFALLMFNPAVWAGVGVACILASGMGESLVKHLQSREKNGETHVPSESISNAKDQIKEPKSLNAEMKKQVSVGKPFVKATDSKNSASIKNIVNRTQQQQSRECCSQLR